MRSRIEDPNDPRHGTPNGYRNLRCRCDLCRKAHAAATREAKYLRRAKLEAGDSEVVHGRSTTYGNHGCRCRPCTDAWAAYWRDLAERKREAS